MAEHEKFHYETLCQLQEKIKELNVPIETTEDLSPLHEQVRVGNKFAPNAFAVLPMEGCDSELDGTPSELTQRRYLRFAAGGAGLLWWEANAVVTEGRANERQMMLHDGNQKAFADLLCNSKQAAAEKNGAAHTPINVLQLTHSGRYSRPHGHTPAPIIPQHDPILDARSGVRPDDAVCTDEYLDQLVGRYVHSAKLAQETGFDGVDVKCCHRYLLSELLASHTRGGKYGGSFENRTRLPLTIIREIRKACGEDFIIASRFNVFDAHPYPYGFGCSQNDLWEFDPTEPMAFVRAMKQAGVNLLSNSAGNPYYIYPQVTRPFDVSSMGIPTPEEHPLESIARLFAFTRLIQQQVPDIPVVGNGYSWLRQYIPYVGAANLKSHSCSLVGMGRQSFAYPNSVYDTLHTGAMDAKKCCITCSRCTQIMRDHGTTGCVIRDAERYAPLYRQFREEAAAREAKK